MNRNVWLLVAASPIMLVAACAAEMEEPFSPADVQPVGDMEEGAGLLADAACEHAQKCHNIGEGAQYATREQCVEVLRPQVLAELQTDARCAGIGLDDTKECAQDFQAQACLDTSMSYAELRRPMSCELRNVCVQ